MNRNIKFGKLVTIVCSVVVGALCDVNANVITVQNPGFEAMTGPANTTHFDASGRLRDGHFSGIADVGNANEFVTSNPIPSWTVTGNDLGSQNPPALAFPSVPDGQDTAYIGGTIGGGTISQTLSATLAIGTYTLQVDVGDLNGLSFAGYRIQLLAGNVLLAEDNNTLVPANGGFVTSTVAYTALASDPNLGIPLTIRLAAIIPGFAHQSGFDHVRLTGPAVQGGLVAQYHFDESSGTTASDSAGSLDGTLSATGATFVAGGIAGNAISLDKAAGGLVNMGPMFPGFLTGDYSIVAWIKTTSLAFDSVVASKHDGNSPNGYFLFVNPSDGGGSPGKASFFASGRSGGPSSAVSTTNVNDGVWHQIVGVYSANGSYSIYVDGAPAESSRTSESMVNNAAAFTVGGIGGRSGNNTPEAHFTGLIDEVQVYARALTDSEITYLFNNPSQSIQTLGPLTLERDGSGFRLTWPGNGILQSNSTLTGSWADVNGGTATSPFLIPNPNDRDFFRLRN